MFALYWPGIYYLKHPNVLLKMENARNTAFSTITIYIMLINHINLLFVDLDEYFT